MAKSEASVEELVNMIKRGDIRLPEMQRKYVWRAPRVRDLLDSLYRGYPSGSILLWETDMEVSERDFSISQDASPYKTGKLLLDGQQRLTSLSSVMRGEPIQVRGRKRPIDILFNLEHPEELSLVIEVNEEGNDEADESDSDSDEVDNQKRRDQMTFVVATRNLKNMPNWISVTEVFRNSSDTDFLRKAGITNWDDPRYDKYNKRLQKLRNITKYEYRLDVLERHLSYEEVTEIFVRVNSLGAKLRGSDLALAQITAKWHNSRKEFEEFQKECDERRFKTDLGTYIRALVCFATDQSRFQTVNTLKLDLLKDSWDKAKEGLEFAMNFLNSNTDIDSMALLSSPYFLLTIAFYGFQKDFDLSPEEARLLRTWLLAANAKGRYSRGSSESLLDQDLSTIKGSGVSGMIDNLRRQFGRLEITKEDLPGRTQRSGLFKTMYLAFKQKCAKDWHSQVVISVNNTGTRHKLQSHHIFPKAYLADTYEDKLVNDICNLAFVDGKTNRRISNRPPKEYFREIIQKQGRETLEAQCVPTDETLLDKDSYEAFLDKRRELISDRLNRFIGKADF